MSPVRATGPGGWLDPALEDKPYVWRNTPGWTPESVDFKGPGDPKPLPAAIAQNMADAQARRVEYWALRDDEGLTREEAAARMGFSVDTARRYDARRKSGGGS